MGRRGPVVAIDGAAGAGKSTLGRRLASELGLPYLNTGVMYRTVTAHALARGADLDEPDALVRVARAIRFEMDAEADPPELVVDGRRPGDDLLTPGVERSVSRVARHPPLRALMAAEQRRLGAEGAVVEGRDIGTVVFPDADVKVFLRADPAVRAARRAAERDADQPTEARELAEALAERDALDARTNPLVPADDAVTIDTVGATPDEVLGQALAVIRARLSPAPRAPAGGMRVLPQVAVVGRPNVGKSTLVNRLFGRRVAIAHSDAGVTRDRVDVPVSWRGRSFTATDTGGYVPRGRGIEGLVREQAELAAGRADVVLFVVDATTGIQEEDLAVARRLRRALVPVIVVANKLDSPQPDPSEVAELYGLGLGEPVPVSALHGHGSGELLDRVLAVLPAEEGEAPTLDEEARFSIVGRPNVGKSSLFNRLVGEERAVVHETAGTTRDAVDSVVSWDGRRLRFVDTAGFRKRTRLHGVEYYGIVRALQAIDRSDVALVVVDASEGVTGEDKRLLSRTAEAGRGLVVAANKWDLVPPEERAERFADITEALAVFPGVPVLRASALSGQGVHRVVPALLQVHGAWSRRVSTSEVNKVLERAVGERPPSRNSGRPRYGTQVGTGPPRFVIFATGPVEAGYRRYLENRLRSELGFGGVPLRLTFRQRKPRQRSGPGRRRPPSGGRVGGI